MHNPMKTVFSHAKNPALYSLPIVAASAGQTQAAVVHYTDLEGTVNPWGVNVFTGEVINSGSLSSNVAAFYVKNKSWNDNIYVGFYRQDDSDTGLAKDLNDYARVFSYNELIDSSLDFSGTEVCSYYNGTTSSNWQADGQRYYLGVRLDDGEDYFYGWIDMSIGSDGTLRIYELAYEDQAGVGIYAGVVPEPAATTALAGLMAGSIAAYGARRRRKAVAE